MKKNLVYIRYEKDCVDKVNRSKTEYLKNIFANKSRKT